MMLNAPHTGARVRVQSYAGRSVAGYRNYFGQRAMPGHAVADRGAWLPPRSTTMVTNRTGAWEPVGPPGARRERCPTADEIAAAIVRALRAEPPVVRVDEVHRGLLAHKRGRGNIALGLG
jgi:hypothetical protein